MLRRALTWRICFPLKGSPAKPWSCTDWVDAHLNYGVALARGGHLREAAAEFRETLRLRPQDAQARQMLEEALRGVH